MAQKRKGRALGKGGFILCLFPHPLSGQENMVAQSSNATGSIDRIIGSAELVAGWQLQEPQCPKWCRGKMRSAAHLQDNTLPANKEH